MAADPLDALRLRLMQDVLPVGVALVERARRGGVKDVVEAFSGSRGDPLGELRDEGEAAASRLRDGLDQLRPGLGNPVMKVDVRVEPPQCTEIELLPDDPSKLVEILERMAARLALLEHRLMSS